MLVRCDQDVRPAPGAHLGILNLLVAVLGGSLAGHQAQEETALGVDCRVVPVVTAEAVKGIVGVRVGFLFPDEAPPFIELDLLGGRGKKPPARRGVFRRGCRPGPRSA